MRFCKYAGTAMELGCDAFEIEILPGLSRGKAASLSHKLLYTEIIVHARYILVDTDSPQSQVLFLRPVFRL
jgi:hypothetical protein